MSIPRRTLFGKLNVDLFRAIESATVLAKLRGNPYVEVVHWLHQLWQAPNGDFHRLATHYSLDIAQVERDLTVALTHLPTGAAGVNDFGHMVELAIERAWVFASLTMRDQRIRGAWLLGGMLQTPDLRRVLLGVSASFQRIPVAQMAEDFPLAVRGSGEDAAMAHESTDWQPALPGEASGALDPEPHGQSALVKYCADLTALAREGGIDPVVGREQEIRTMMDILLRRRQNNPLLTGEAGVGKTAVVEGLALAVVGRLVPPSLHRVRILSLDVGALLAGASMRGEFESRLKAVLREAADSQVPVILFVDEVHTLIGAGGQAGTGDAANLLKPALARGAFRVIGATTWSEYKKHIEKDPALTRRFQMLQVLEPQESAAVAMVRGLVPAFARHHGVTVLDEAVRAAVCLSHRYIPARQLPDKAISLLDTACARVAMSLHAPSRELETIQARRDALQGEHTLLLQEASIGKDRCEALREVQQRMADVEHEHKVLADAGVAERLLTSAILEKREACRRIEDENSRRVLACELQALERDLHQLQGDRPGVHTQVDEGVVASIVADWTGIPVGRMVRDDLTTVLSLEDQLRKRVIGQDAALSTVAARVKTARAHLGDPHKPLGVFLLVGPSGVGKTETALALAQAVYGGEHNLITINMSEYQEAHTVSGLKGSPPGYVGYGEGGVLTEAVRRRPYSVVLLDEVEKAHPDVHELFYQVFDKGSMEDGEGRAIDFRNTLILLTSNTGSDLLHQLCEDPVLLPETQALMDALQPELRKVFPAAFLGRLLVVPYLPLSAGLLESIVRLQLQKVVARMQEQHGVLLEFNRAPRVQIEYDVEIYGSEKKIELPFVMGVLADLSGKPVEPLPGVDERKFLEIDIDNFDERMKAIAPRVAFSVPNTLTGDRHGVRTRKLLHMNPLRQLLASLVGISPDPLAGASGVSTELLAPVSEIAPCGESLEYDADHAVLQARLAPQSEVQYGSFSSRPEAPDWAEVERDARGLLVRSKDIAVLVWFTRARCRLAGAAGLLEGLLTLQSVLQAYPEQVHPQVVLDGVPDPAVRANALAALCDPDGLLGDVRDVVVSGGTAFRLTVRDVERAFAVPRPPYAPEPEGVKRQLADLHVKGDGALRALLACGNAVLGIDHWSQGALGDDAPNLGPLMHLLGCLAAFAVAPVRAEKLQIEDVESDGLRPGFQAQLVGAPTSPGDPVEARWSAPLALPAAGATHAHIVQEREQIRALLRHIRHWVERHEPSSPVTILLKQADRMWGRRFAEVAHMIPSDLMQAWDRDD